MSRLVRLEWPATLWFFGLAVTAIRNRVGWWRKSTYGDEGLISIENAATLRGSSYEVVPVEWKEIGWIVLGLKRRLAPREWFLRYRLKRIEALTLYGGETGLQWDSERRKWFHSPHEKRQLTRSPLSLSESSALPTVLTAERSQEAELSSDLHISDLG